MSTLSEIINNKIGNLVKENYDTYYNLLGPSKDPTEKKIQVIADMVFAQIVNHPEVKGKSLQDDDKHLIDKKILESVRGIVIRPILKENPSVPNKKMKKRVSFDEKTIFHENKKKLAPEKYSSQKPSSFLELIGELLTSS